MAAASQAGSALYGHTWVVAGQAQGREVEDAAVQLPGSARVRRGNDFTRHGAECRIRNAELVLKHSGISSDL